MAPSAPEPKPGKKAGGASATESPRPSSGDALARMPSGWPFPSIPDHELLRCIGRGAYGAVWLARNVMGTYRAVKIIHAEDFTRDRPFLREYEGLLKYEPVSRSHPSLMQILHVGRREGYFYYVTELADDANAECGRPCPQEHPIDQGAASIVTESTLPGAAGGDARAPHVHPSSELDPDAPVAIPPSAIRDPQSYVPRTLHEDLQRRGRLPAPECLRIAVALASALKHLHDHQLVHRDVKPSNVIFVHGVPKLADIGLVTTVGDSRSIVGTEGYLPPEGPGSAQADLYALGKLLYESSTGMSRRDYPSLPVNLREWPDAEELLEFNEVLLRACARDTDRRYHRADDLLADLALIERGDSVKRLRRLERHHAVLKRLGVAVLAVGLLVSAAWWQSWRAHSIARHHLAQLHVNEGVQRMVRGDYAAALPWLVGALELDAGDPIREQAHRMRLAGVLERCPLPVAQFSVPDSKLLAADLKPDGALVATAHEVGGVRLWDTRSGECVRRLHHDFPVVVCQFAPAEDRLLTVTVGQQAHLWDLANADRAPLTFDQANGFDSDGYSVGLNGTLGRAYLSKGSRRFARMHSNFKGPFENLTLGLKLIGQGDTLVVRYVVRQTAPEGRVLYEGEFRDSPGAEPFDAGPDDPPGPLWGRLFLMLENASVGEKPGDRSRVVWDNLKLRRYPSRDRPPPWRVVADFANDELRRWVHFAPPDSGSACRVEDGRLVLSCENLPLAHLGWRGVLWRELFEVSPGHALEVEVDLVSVQAPHRQAGLGLFRPKSTELATPDRSLLFGGRWLVLTWWDGTVWFWDLDRGAFADIGQEGRNVPLELRTGRIAQDTSISPDSKHFAQVGSGGRCSIWDLRNGREIVVEALARWQATGARFSPDNRFLAVTHADGFELIRTADWKPVLNLGKGQSFDHPVFSPSGSRLAAARDEREVVVWDMGDRTEPPVTFTHHFAVRCLRFSPDGRYLASSSAGGLVRVWDVNQRKQFGPPLPGNLTRFSGDGTRLLLLDQSRAWLWDLSRVTDDAVAVPPPSAEQRFVASNDRSLTAEIQGREILLKTRDARYSLANPEQLPWRRITLSADSHHLIAETSDLRVWTWDLPTRTLIGPPKSGRYDPELTNAALPNLAADARDRRALSDWAALLGGQRPDGEGGMRPVDQAERKRLLDSFHRINSEPPTAADANRARWHREQAEGAEQAMDWDAALFHWEQVLKRKSESGNRKAESSEAHAEIRKGESADRFQEPVAADVNRLEFPIDQSGLTSAATDSKSRVAAGDPQSAIRNPHSAISPQLRLDYARRAADAVRQAMHRGRSCWSVILPRPPWATSEMLDLESCYTLPLGEPLATNPPGVAFRELVGGVRCLGGTGFDVRGIIRLDRTNSVTIPVGRICERIHFLHASSRAVDRAGLREPVGRYQATYDSGETASVNLMNPEDAPPYSANDFFGLLGMEWTGTSPELRCALVWSGSSAGWQKPPEPLYLTRTTWELPARKRGEIVRSLELQAGPGDSAPLVFAITVE